MTAPTPKDGLREALMRALLNESEAGGGCFPDLADAVLVVIAPLIAQLATAEARADRFAGVAADMERRALAAEGNADDNYQRWLSERDRALAAEAALTKLVSSFEGDALPFTDEQEQAYEEAAALLDTVASLRSLPVPETQETGE